MTYTRRLALLTMALCASAVVASAEPLIEAAKHRDAAAVRVLLANHVDPNVVQPDGATALHWAAHRDDLEIARLLIEGGARVSTATPLGVTPLYLACTNRGAEMVRLLLRSGAQPNVALASGETVLMNCARTGDVEAVRALLEHGASVNAAESTHGQTALMWAAAQRHADVVATLVAGGADVAAHSRIYPQTVTSEDTTRVGREELNYEVQRGGSTPLLFAARSGDARSVRILVEAGADVDEAQPDGLTALALAAYSGHGAAGIELVELGADPNIMTIGYAPLHAAVLRGQLELVKSLLAHGADPNARMTRGTPIRRISQDFNLPATLIGATPYMLAARFLEVEIMRVLAEYRADPRLPTLGTTTPLMAAAGAGASNQTDRRGVRNIDGSRSRLEGEDRVLDAVMAAIEAGADVNATDQAGDTALHATAPFGYTRIIRALVGKGADVNARNKRSLTPLGALLARKGQQAAASEETVALLRSLGGVE